MISIRIAIASLLAAGALLAGGVLAQHNQAASVSHKTVVAGPVLCCDARMAGNGPAVGVSR
ncbi:MAG TPA: hypothetical protein VKB62_05295 [Streptosporangiaceae bacterium]|nr:hypothetical protein [Streptosporangiaceae bacterium]